MDHFVKLQEIQLKGGVAQVALASELIKRIAVNPHDSALRNEVNSLYDAYLNDPYLDKTQG